MKKDWIMNALVDSPRSVVPYARTRYNIIPCDNQEVATQDLHCVVTSPRQPLETRCLKESMLLLAWMMR
eukprot:11315945-Prorocentrum_lima.AAC.1